MDRAVQGIWRAANVLLCILLVYVVTHNLIPLVIYQQADRGDFLTFLALVTALVLGGIYHVYRLLRLSRAKIALEGPPRLSSFLSEAFVVLSVAPVILISIFDFGMHLDSFLYRMGPSMYLKTLQAAETAHCLTHNRTYTDNVEDLVAGKQSRNGLSDGLKLGYQIKLTVTDGGRHYAAVVRCGLCGVDRRNEYWYYTDDTGVVCMAPAGTEPTKDSDKMF